MTNFESKPDNDKTEYMPLDENKKNPKASYKNNPILKPAIDVL